MRPLITVKASQQCSGVLSFPLGPESRVTHLCMKSARSLWPSGVPAENQAPGGDPARRVLRLLRSTTSRDAWLARPAGGPGRGAAQQGVMSEWLGRPGEV